MVRTASSAQKEPSQGTYRFASASAIHIVILYPASSLLKLSIFSPMYFNFAQSRKLVRLALDRDEHFSSSCLNSLQALPHRLRGRSSDERSSSVVALIVSVSCAKTPHRASSSSSRSRTSLGCDRKLWII